MSVPGRLGPYDIVAELGRGAMGVVYRAVDRRLQREVALKVLMGSADAAGLEDFVREARAAARLRHPGIVVVYGADVIDGLRVVALELVQGGSLQQRLRASGPLGSREAAQLVADLSAAVEAAHREGIVHRDLKPANVLLERDGRPRLTDFGLARDERAGGRSASGDIIGTPAYMAPEQARGDVHRVGPRTDVWGLGAVLFECLAGRPPFQGRTAHEVMKSIIEDPAPSPSKERARRGLEPLPDDLSTICLTALAKDPGRRYASPGALEEDLRRWLDGRPIQATPPDPLREMLRAWRRHRLAIGVGVVAAVITGLLLLIVPDLLGRRAREEAHAAVLASVGAGEGRLVREKAVFELTKDKDLAAVPVLIDALGALTARLQEVTHARLVAVLEPRDQEERARQDRIAALPEALDAATKAAGDERLARAHVRAIDEARRRLALREGRGRRPEVILAAEHRIVLGDDALLRASVAAEALGRLGDPSAADVLGRYLHVEEDPERVLLVAQALGRLHDLRAARSVLRMDERQARGGSCLNRAEYAFARELGGTLPAFEPVSALDHLDRGRLRALLDDVAGAMTDFDRALELDPADAYAWACRAGMHADDQAWALAVADIDRALALEPDDPDHLGSRAWVLANQGGATERALADAERAVELDAFDAQAYTARAFARAQSRDRAGALADLSRAIELDPAYPTPWSSRARIREENGDHQGAIDDDTRALALDPDRPAVWNNRALARQNMGDLEGAIADMSRALELKPKDPVILANRAHLRSIHGDTAGALDDATAALEVKPTYGQALCIRGQTRMKLGDMEGARQDIRAALEVAPDDPTSWGVWGIFAMATDDLREARRAFERQLELTPNSAIACTSLSYALLRLGDLPGATEAARRATELDRRDASAWRALAEMLGAVEDARGALNAIENAVALDPADANGWRERGKYRYLLGDLQGALSDTVRAVELNPRDAANVGMRGQVYRFLGERAAAIRDFERMLELMDPKEEANLAAIRGVLDELRSGAPPPRPQE